MESRGVSVKDMEAAAVAWASHLHACPMFALKSITDIVDGTWDSTCIPCKTFYETQGPGGARHLGSHATCPDCHTPHFLASPVGCHVRNPRPLPHIFKGDVLEYACTLCTDACLP